MGEPIRLAGGRIAYGQAQAQEMMHDTVASTATAPLQESASPVAFDWTQVRGVSTEISRALNYMGLSSPGALRSFVATPGNDLTDVPGIGEARAAAIVAWAEGNP